MRRFQTLSTQDMAQFVIVGLLTGCFWWQRAAHSNLAAAADTLGTSPCCFRKENVLYMFTGQISGVAFLLRLAVGFFPRAVFPV